jgi:hypothetical protein
MCRESTYAEFAAHLPQSISMTPQEQILAPLSGTPTECVKSCADITPVSSIETNNTASTSMCSTKPKHISLLSEAADVLHFEQKTSTRFTQHAVSLSPNHSKMEIAML